MTHGSLFSGIGGFDLAAEWMGWENKFHCEWNEFGKKVLGYYWPASKSYNDIRESDFTEWRQKIDILSGGFPCQPFSLAGKRKGTEDERHLWPEMLRAIREIQPRWIVGENVFGIVNWSGGLVFEEVCSDLEAEGYEVQPYILPAAGKNAPHKRDRIWFVAHSNERNDRRAPRENEGKSGKERVQERDTIWESIEPGEIFRFVAHTNKRGHWINSGEESKTEKIQRERGEKRFPRYIDGTIRDDRDATDTQRIRSSRKEYKKEKSRFNPEAHQRCWWENFPTQSPICSGDDGIPDKLDGITFPKWRNESIKAYGNAIVPQVVYEIFKAIVKYEEQFNNNSL